VNRLKRGAPPLMDRLLRRSIYSALLEVFQAVGDAVANCPRCADLSHTHRAALLRLISSTLRIRRCVLGEKRFYLQVEIIPRPKLESFHENVFRLIPEVPQ
jgi:hypothetical protein